MANAGKFIDRAPNIRAAGIIYADVGGTSNALKIYSMEEAAEEIMRTKCMKHEGALRQRPIPRYPIIPINKLEDALSPELSKSRFVAFRERLTENMYFKKHQLGQVFELQSKPEHITNTNTTFGKKLERSETLYSVVLPKKDPDTVNREYATWHDKYIVSHRHYFPSERINRNYDRKHFNPRATFGIYKNVDITGGNLRRCLTTCERLILISKAQKAFLERTTGKLGKRIGTLPNANITSDMAFGVRDIDPTTVQSLMENVPPGASKKQYIDAIAHINKWRHILYKSVDFHMHDLASALEDMDIENTGYLSVAQLCEAAHHMHIRIDENKMRLVMRYFKMIENECCENERVNYMHFWKLLIMQYPLPSVGNMLKREGSVCPKDDTTTYRLLCQDMDKNLPEEGEHAKLWRELHKQYITTAKDLVQPDIPMKFGLCPRDFELPRSKDELGRIFKTVLPEGFDNLWQRALDKYKPENKLMSVNELRAILHEN